MTGRLHIKLGHSDNPDPRTAISELAAQLDQPGTSLIILFCSSTYNLTLLSTELDKAFDCPVIGCTTAGEISSGQGFQQGTIVGASLASTRLQSYSFLIQDIDQFNITQAEKLVAEIKNTMQVESFSISSMFAFLLIDGLSMAEENVTANLYRALEGLPLIGGSAGDNLVLSQTHVLHNGKFVQNCGIVTIFDTDLPFHIFKTHHLAATTTKLVITATIPRQRCVTEINGFPAVEEYSRAIGVTPEELTPATFSKHPLLLKIGGEYYARSISKANPDGSLSLFCDIDTGLVVTMASSGDLEGNIKSTIREIEEKIENPRFILACDCILRKIEMEENGLDSVAANLFSNYNFLGFSTYGEQFNSVHINQTLTGVVFGE